MVYATRENVAYQDYQTAEVQQPAHSLRAVPTQTPRVFFRPRVLMTIVLCLAVAGLIIYSQMTMTALTSELSAARESLSNLEASNIALQTKQETGLSMASVEEYAQNELGMVKLDSSQIEYVEMSSPDKIEVSGGALSGAVSGVLKSFSAVTEYLH